MNATRPLTQRENELVQRGINKWDMYIRKLAFKHKNRVADVEDLIQEAYLAIMKAATKYSEDRDGASSFETMAFSYITNRIYSVTCSTFSPLSIPGGSGRAVDSYDEYKREGDIDSIPVVDGNSEEEIDLLDLIDTFDTPERVGYYHFIEGYSLKELANSTGFSISTIGRTIAKIREEIEKELEL